MSKFNRDELFKDADVIIEFTRLIFDEALMRGGADEEIFNAYTFGYYFLEKYYEGEESLEDCFSDAWLDAVEELRAKGDESLSIEFDLPSFPDPTYDTEYHGQLMMGAVESLLPLLPNHIWRLFPGNVADGFYSRN